MSGCSIQVNRLRIILAAIALIFLPVNMLAADINSIIESCDGCHGKDGASSDPHMPTIAGASAQFILDTFKAYEVKARPCRESKYVSGARKGETSNMCKAIEGISEADTKALAEHYASKPFVKAKQPFDAALVKAGKKLHNRNCKKCHADNGSSPDDDSGILAGQWTPYLQQQLDDYMAGKRQMSEKMKKKMDKMQPEDLKALLNFYASFQ